MRFFYLACAALSLFFCTASHAEMRCKVDKKGSGIASPFNRRLAMMVRVPLLLAAIPGIVTKKRLLRALPEDMSTPTRRLPRRAHLIRGLQNS